MPYSEQSLNLHYFALNLPMYMYVNSCSDHLNRTKAEMGHMRKVLAVYLYCLRLEGHRGVFWELKHLLELAVCVASARDFSSQC